LWREGQRRALGRERFGVEHGKEGSPGYETPATEADDRELAPSNELVGEGPGDPEERAGLGHGQHQAVALDGDRQDGLGHGRVLRVRGDGHGGSVRCGRPRNRPQQRPQQELSSFSLRLPRKGGSRPEGGRLGLAGLWP